MDRARLNEILETLIPLTEELSKAQFEAEAASSSGDGWTPDGYSFYQATEALATAIGQLIAAKGRRP